MLNRNESKSLQNKRLSDDRILDSPQKIRRLIFYLKNFQYKKNIFDGQDCLLLFCKISNCL